MTAKEFFEQEMERGCAIFRVELSHVIGKLGSSENDRDARKYHLRSYSECRWPLPESDVGAMGTLLLTAMGRALLSMKPANWEFFYAGYVQWARDLPRCGYAGHEEENARGAMMLALKYRVDELDRQHQVKDIAA